MPDRLIQETRCAFSKSYWVDSKIGDITLDAWQRTAIDCEQKFQIWNCSRQSGKSTLASLLSLHESIYNEKSLTVVISPSLRQSQELTKKIRHYYVQLEDSPKQMEQSNQLTMEFSNGSRILSIPANVTTIRGYSPDLALIDEAAGIQDDIFHSVFPMIAATKGQLVLLSSPYGQRGFFYNVWIGKGNELDDWFRTEVPVSMCPRIDETYLKQALLEMGKAWFDQEFNCSFIQKEGALFSPEQIASMFTVRPEDQAIADDIKEQDILAADLMEFTEWQESGLNQQLDSVFERYTNKAEDNEKSNRVFGTSGP